jgi:hypothetical protein
MNRVKEQTVSDFLECKLFHNVSIKTEDFDKANELQIKQTENFAIGFSFWLMQNVEKTEYNYQYIYKGKEMHISYLLEIYKRIINL